MPVETITAPNGIILHIISQPATTLPPVTKRDIEQAWEAAQTTGQSAINAATPRAFRFLRPGQDPVELHLTDPDAAAWADAVDRAAGLSTTHGVAVCLRLLALIELMSRASSLRAWFSIKRGSGAALHPALLQAAALAPLTDTGGFDETALHTLLPLP